MFNFIMIRKKSLPFFFRINSDWMSNNFPEKRRYGSMIFEAKNVLDPEVIRTMFRVRKSITQIESSSGLTWSTICMQVPGNKII